MLFGAVHGGGGGQIYTMWSRDLKCVFIFFYRPLLLLLFLNASIATSVYACDLIFGATRGYWFSPGKKVYIKSVYFYTYKMCMKKMFFFLLHTAHCVISVYIIIIYTFLSDGWVYAPTAVGLRLPPSRCTYNIIYIYTYKYNKVFRVYLFYPPNIDCAYIFDFDRCRRETCFRTLHCGLIYYNITSRRAV